jgi:hypothetical protein
MSMGSRKMVNSQNMAAMKDAGFVSVALPINNLLKTILLMLICAGSPQSHGDRWQDWLL